MANPVQAKKVVPVTAKKADPKDLKKSKRPTHPGIGKTGYPFSEVPEDFNFDTMKGLRKSDFSSKSAFYQYRAAECRFRAEKFDAMSVDTAKKGGKDGRRLAKMIAQIAKLRETLSAQGIDVEALEEQAKNQLETPAK